MSLYSLAQYCTAPDLIKFACKNGIKQNPMYMQCDICPNQNFCEIYFANTPAPELSPREKEMIRKDLENARNYNKPKLTPAEQWREIRIGMAVFAAIIFIGWLMS